MSVSVSHAPRATPVAGVSRASFAGGVRHIITSRKPAANPFTCRTNAQSRFFSRAMARI